MDGCQEQSIPLSPSRKRTQGSSFPNITFHNHGTIEMVPNSYFKFQKINAGVFKALAIIFKNPTCGNILLEALKK